MIERDADHVYRVDGVVKPGVTEILKRLNLDAFSRVSPVLLEHKRDLGRRVHMACEFDDQGDLREDSITDDVRPYLQAWRNFRVAKGIVTISAECYVYNRALDYCGQVDWHGLIDDIEWTLDRKCTGVVLPSYGPQTAGYDMALPPPRRNVRRRGLLQLSGDGTYKLVPCTGAQDAAVFLSCRNIFNYLKGFQ